MVKLATLHYERVNTTHLKIEIGRKFMITGLRIAYASV